MESTSTHMEKHVNKTISAFDSEETSINSEKKSGSYHSVITKLSPMACGPVVYVQK